MPNVREDKDRARQPRQARAKERFDQVLDAARGVLRAEGLAGFSIPVLADRLGYTRASIYKFFPTPQAILNELVQQDLAELEARLTTRASDLLSRDWRHTLREIVLRAAKFYNANPVARLLVLGRPTSDDSYRALEITIQHLGGLTRELLLTRGIVVPRHKPDAATLLVEIGTTCFRLSQYLHGEITPEYMEEAVQAMTAYLSRYATGSERLRKAANE